MLFLKAPSFWNKTHGVFWCIWYLFLKPISLAYAFFSKMHHNKPYKHKTLNGSRVISVGGCVIGGSGKTVVVSHICGILRSKNLPSAVVMLGYGRAKNDTTVVDHQKHSYCDVGDEPFMLSKRGFDVVVGPDRYTCAKLATNKLKSKVIILDDGFSQRDLQPSINIVVIDSMQLFGNGEVFPLGPNRVDFNSIKHTIDVIIIIKSSTHLSTDSSSDDFCVTMQLNNPSVKILTAHTQTSIDIDKSQRVFAFCGIGFPEKFFNSLQDYNVVGTQSFPDHYPYSKNDIEKIIEKSKILNASIVTTEKDHVKIPDEFKRNIIPSKLEILFNNTDLLNIL